MTRSREHRRLWCDLISVADTTDPCSARGCFPPFSFPPIIVMVLRAALVRSLRKGDHRGTHC